MSHTAFSSRAFRCPAFEPMVPLIAAPSGGVNSSYAVGFDGTNDYIVTSASIRSPAAGDLTLCGWFYLGSVSALQSLFSQLDGTGTGQSWLEITAAAKLQSQLGGSATTGTRTLVAGLWHHLAVTVSGTTLTLYVNGLADTTATRTMQAASGVNNIGASKTPGNYFNGRIDDLRIYNRALTAAEVQSIYRNSSAPPTSGLVCYFPLDEGTGTTVTDSIGGLIGTLTNGPTWQTQVCPRLKSGRDVTARSKAYSLSFDGTDDYITCGNVTQANFGTGNFTVAFWAKWTDTGSGTFVGKDTWSLSNDNGLFLAQISGQSGKVAYWNGSTNTYAGTGLNDNAWHHVAAVRTGTGASQVLLYIDGVQTATATDARNLSNSRAFTINGSDDNSAMSYLASSMREVRIYNSALSSADIRTLAIGGNPSATPVGHWELNEGTGTTATDTGSGGNNGTLTNGPTWSTDVPQWWRQDRHTWSLACDGSNDWVSVAHNAVHCPATAITVSAWVKPTASTGLNQGVVSKSATATNGWLLYRSGAAGSEQWVFGVHRNSSSFVNPGSAAGTAAQLNVWYHVAGTYDSATGLVKVYVNGVLMGTSSPTSGSITASTTGLAIGNNYTTTQLFPGNIKDARVYDVALSDADIAKLANNVEPSATPVGHWPLDEGAGTTAIDKSGNGNNGTLTNGPVYTGDIPQWFRSTIESSYALSCDGVNDYVQIADNASIDANLTSGMSIVAWFNPTSLPVSTLQMIASKYATGATDSSYYLGVYDSNGDGVAELRGYVVKDAANTNTIQGTIALTAGRWTHAALTHTVGGLTTLYTNAVSSGSITGAGVTSVLNTAIAFNIGARNNGGQPFNGQIDEVAVYSRALTVAELADSASGYLVSAGLVSRYKLDNNANDAHGTNHGTEQGGVGYSTSVPRSL